MYSWIWRKLPFGLPGKITGSLVLTAGVLALLWFWVFPTVEPMLPFDDVQVGTDDGQLTPDSDPGVSADPSATTR